MFLLYRACGNETSQQVKISALAWGADVDFSDDWYDPVEVEPDYITGDNIKYVPIGLGYEAQ